MLPPKFLRSFRISDRWSQYKPRSANTFLSVATPFPGYTKNVVDSRTTTTPPSLSLSSAMSRLSSNQEVQVAVAFGGILKNREPRLESHRRVSADVRPFPDYTKLLGDRSESQTHSSEWPFSQAFPESGLSGSDERRQGRERRGDGRASLRLCHLHCQCQLAQLTFEMRSSAVASRASLCRVWLLVVLWDLVEHKDRGMSRPTTTTAALLPALSAALGLPSGLRRLDHGASGRGDADISCAGGPSSDGGDRGERGDGSPPGRVPRDLAARARDNASRIYARRVVDRAKEEGEHPWNSAGRRRRKEGRRRREADNGGAGPPSPSAIRSARDRILSEALVGLADLQYGPGIGSPGGDFGVGRGLPRGILPPSVASCEGTRDLYGRLSASIDSGPSAASDSGVVDDAEKPAEWGEGIDLAERRLGGNGREEDRDAGTPRGAAGGDGPAERGAGEGRGEARPEERGRRGRDGEEAHPPAEVAQVRHPVDLGLRPLGRRDGRSDVHQARAVGVDQERPLQPRVCGALRQAPGRDEGTLLEGDRACARPGLREGLAGRPELRRGHRRRPRRRRRRGGGRRRRRRQPHEEEGRRGQPVPAGQAREAGDPRPVLLPAHRPHRVRLRRAGLQGPPPALPRPPPGRDVRGRQGPAPEHTRESVPRLLHRQQARRVARACALPEPRLPQREGQRRPVPRHHAAAARPQGRGAQPEEVPEGLPGGDADRLPRADDGTHEPGGPSGALRRGRADAQLREEGGRGTLEGGPGGAGADRTRDGDEDDIPARFHPRRPAPGKHDRRPQQVGARQSHPHNHDRLRPHRRARRARSHEPRQDPRLPHKARRLRRRRADGRRGQEVPGLRARRRALLPRHREDMHRRRGQQLPRERGRLHLGHMLPGVQAQGEARGGVHKRGARVRDHGGPGGEPLPQHGGAERGAPDGAEGGDDARAQEPAVAEAGWTVVGWGGVESRWWMLLYTKFLILAGDCQY
ncbi:hypothetical protein THAOC_27312 [Thalassiosira oceanica]|uniref:Uncharacterized protein n=1 Tax=Thalassiosira oceanica TaxID=159749 RepID=K0RJ83_THAOC|nr:hypothetical protein THAOC_27312 [Thalassiosira oceanica]|eukprot:EJK53280.1 hypothetical protein THAOC_27312 [Thalassiosira oceanica]